MPTVAEQLRAAREARNLTIHEVADITKIRTDHLRALESGEYDLFTAPVYIRGFVRTYATLLKLEVPKVMAALEAELGQTEKFCEPPPLSRQPRGILDFATLQLSQVNWQRGLLVLIGIILILIALLVAWAWRKHRSRDSLADLPPAMYQAPPQQSGETLPLPSPNPTPARP
jgi:cytoskeleton protein RodZ